MKYKLKLDLEWELEVPSEVDEMNEDERNDALLNLLGEHFYMSNESIDNLFWESIDIRRVD